VGPWLALLAPLLLALGVFYELMVSEPDRWGRLVVGRNSMLCLRTIPILSAPILVALLIAMKKGRSDECDTGGRHGRITRWRSRGRLLRGPCPDGSPLFDATWYGISIALVTVVAAGIGSRVLRW
jgi:hypothetical protein